MEVAIAIITLGLVALGLLVWQSRSAARAKTKQQEAEKDIAAREDFDEAAEEWDSAGGLAGGMRDPE